MPSFVTVSMQTDEARTCQVIDTPHESVEAALEFARDWASRDGPELQNMRIVEASDANDAGLQAMTAQWQD